MVRMTFTITEAANLLGIGRSAAYQAARDGKIPIITIGGRRLVPVGLLEKFLGVEPGSISLPQKEMEPSGLDPNDENIIY